MLVIFLVDDLQACAGMDPALIEATVFRICREI